MASVADIVAQLSPADQAAMSPETFANPAVQQVVSSMASLPRRAIENSQQSLDTGNYDPGPTLEAAALPMGTGAIAGVPLRMGEMALGAGPIRAYHGSPHDFDAFSMDKIGTGEGAQAYGHGLYFAEEPQVAQQYRDQLRWKGADFNDPQTIAQNALDRHGDRTAAADSLQSAVDSTKRFHGNKMPQSQAEANASTEQAIAALRSNEPITGAPPTPGGMYEANINADSDHFLDWDKPLPVDHPVLDLVRQKSQEILDRSGGFGSVRNEAKDAILAAQNGNMTGEGAYKALARGQSKLGNLPNPAAATQILREAGIPGIKYLDQGSRAAGEGSRNYVVFDDKLVNIARKYGMGSIAALPPAALAALQQQDAPSQ